MSKDEWLKQSEKLDEYKEEFSGYDKSGPDEDYPTKKSWKSHMSWLSEQINDLEIELGIKEEE